MTTERDDCALKENSVNTINANGVLTPHDEITAREITSPASAPVRLQGDQARRNKAKWNVATFQTLQKLRASSGLSPQQLANKLGLGSAAVLESYTTDVAPIRYVQQNMVDLDASVREGKAATDFEPKRRHGKSKLKSTPTSQGEVAPASAEATSTNAPEQSDQIGRVLAVIGKLSASELAKEPVRRGIENLVLALG